MIITAHAMTDFLTAPVTGRTRSGARENIQFSMCGDGEERLTNLGERGVEISSFELEASI